MLDYRCPDCRRKFFEAGGPIAVLVEVMCRNCREVVVPEACMPRHVTYRCSQCGLTQHAENPKQDKTYCVPCGLHTMKPVRLTPIVDRPAVPAYISK